MLFCQLGKAQKAILNPKVVMALAKTKEILEEH